MSSNGTTEKADVIPVNDGIIDFEEKNYIDAFKTNISEYIDAFKIIYNSDLDKYIISQEGSDKSAAKYNSGETLEEKYSNYKIEKYKPKLSCFFRFLSHYIKKDEPNIDNFKKVLIDFKNNNKTAFYNYSGYTKESWEKSITQSIEKNTTPTPNTGGRKQHFSIRKNKKKHMKYTRKRHI